MSRRRKPPGHFRACIPGHPLLRPLAARLTWGLYNGDILVQAFRIAEDRTLTDAYDNPYHLPDHEHLTVSVAHPLDLGPSTEQAFTTLLADYEIVQPFRQLGRETYTLTPDEHAGTVITRFAHKKIAPGVVGDLTRRGWERGERRDGRWVDRPTRHLGSGHRIRLDVGQDKHRHGRPRPSPSSAPDPTAARPPSATSTPSSSARSSARSTSSLHPRPESRSDRST